MSNMVTNPSHLKNILSDRFFDMEDSSVTDVHQNDDGNYVFTMHVTAKPKPAGASAADTAVSQAITKVITRALDDSDDDGGKKKPKGGATNAFIGINHSDLADSGGDKKPKGGAANADMEA